MLGFAGLLVLIAAPGSVMSASRQNAAADAVVQYGLALGIDFNEENAKAAHPSPEVTEALASAGFGQWLDAQIQVADDAIGSPPEALNAFLRDHDAAISALTEALEKGTPEWESGSPQNELGPLLPTIRLEKLLLAAALVEERERDFAQSSRDLEASWSLARPLASSRRTIDQLLTIAIAKWQVGALRKIQAPDLQWHGRLANDDCWDGMLAAITADPVSANPKDALDPWSDIRRKAVDAIVELARKSSRCDLLSMSDEELWRPARDALDTESSDERRQIRDLIQEIVYPNLLNEIRRSARLSVDRELTLRVLELRLAKSVSADGTWPEKLGDSWSIVCPGVEYEYRADRSGMAIRFSGSAPAPVMGSVLPLEFRSRNTIPSTPSPTPTPDVVRP